MNKQISEEIIEELRHRADIVEIIGEQVALRKKGQNYTGLCPFHQEKTPSFVVSPGKQIYHCFGCGKGGNVFSFLMEREGASFNEVIEKLAARYGMLLPDREMNPAQQRQAAKVKRYRQINQWAMEYFQQALEAAEGKPGRDYFESRGLDAKIIQRFSLGFAPDRWEGLCHALKAKDVQDEELLLLGLAQTSQKSTLIDKFRNRVMYPIFDDRGNVVGFGGRTLGDGQPKYLNSPDTPLFQKGHHLYALNLAKASIRQQDQVILMEGYMDVIAAHQQGITHVVASLGTALTDEQSKLLTRYTYQSVICYDADAAGEAASMRGLEILNQHGFQVRIIRIPEGKDPDDFIRAHGQEAFLKLADKALSLYEYKFARTIEKFDRESMSGKVGIIQAMLPELAKVKSPVARQGYITLMSERLSFPEAAIKEELRRHQGGSMPKPAGQPRMKTEERGTERAQAGIFRILLEDPSLLKAVEEAGGADLFDNRQAQAVFQTAQALLQAGHQALSGEDLVALIEDGDQRQWLTGVLLEDEIPGDKNKVFQDSLLTLKRSRIDREIKKLMEHLAQLENTGDASRANEIMTKISGLNKEKQTLRP